MSVFKNSDELYDVFGRFFNQIKFESEMGQQIQSSHIIVQWEYSDPEGIVTIDATQKDPDGGYFSVILGPTEIKPEIFMTMKADVAHQFWLGKVNLLSALSRRQIVAKGPIPKALKLLPAIKPSYAMYAEFLRTDGRTEILN
ncbi:MAG: SCP2 sterol-binding domain-containing protein [Acidibacillus sp.]|uniref:SCP2 domain-containing protein n=1 Tax=Sulfoacidibacillus ferrooxidans TaxID=2005001 RepID=A0A9X1V7A0_9BACL|nr:SCP2 sterol-binding domain-containing protein [Sulfoacidibacillus ferrooxidans]MCI0182535.1 hypothetical protein [Sulfoacidibacillus ferrooxidans]MCY0894193.1 SCP2 sterol-binding domain-containing protein [Acidibacillus sp.]